MGDDDERDDDDPLAVAMAIMVLRDCEVRAVEVVLGLPLVRAAASVQLSVAAERRFPVRAGADARRMS